MAGGSTSHRTSRRSRVRRENLPPIPERSLSAHRQKAGDDCVGRSKARSSCEGAAASKGICVGLEKKKNTRGSSSSRRVAPPSPESRRRNASHQATTVAAVESRDDEDEDIPVPTPMKQVYHTHRKRPVKEIVVTPTTSTSLPPPEPSPTSVTSLREPHALSTSKSNRSIGSKKALNVTSSKKETQNISTQDITLIVPTAGAGAATVAPTSDRFMGSKKALNVTSSKKETRIIPTQHITPIVPTAGAGAGASAVAPTSDRSIGPKKALNVSSSKKETRIIPTQDITSIVSAAGARAGVATGAAAGTAVVAPSSTSQTSQVSKAPRNAIKSERLSDAITPFSSNVSRKRIAAVVGSTCDDSRVAANPGVASVALVEWDGPDDERDSRLAKQKEYAPEPSLEDVQHGEHTSAHHVNERSLVVVEKKPYTSWRVGQVGKDKANTNCHPNSNNRALILKAKMDVPNDEIMFDSFFGYKPSKPKYYGDEIMDSTSRETRDQYQLGRLRARIDRRSGGVNSGHDGKSINKVGKVPSPPSDYKTLRSSRLKMRRNLYQNQKHPAEDREDEEDQGNILQEEEEQQEQPVTPPVSPPMSPKPKHHQRSNSSMSNSVHGEGGGGSSANTTSTIPSIQHGLSIGRSMTLSSGISIVPSGSNSGGQQQASASFTQQSVSESVGLHSRLPRSSNNSVAGASSRVQSISNSAHCGNSLPRRSVSNASVELSEYRGKLFAKMLHLLQDISAAHPENVHSLHEDDVSNIKEKVIDESRASCCSIAELKMIQKLTEEEMSRILSEFEQNNSLVEKKEQRAYSSMQDIKYEVGCDVPAPVNNNRMEMMQDENEGRRGRANEKNSRCPPPDIYADNGNLTIFSKVSDVTSPTCHDGFELDEIMPVGHQKQYNCNSQRQPHLPQQQPSMSPLPPLPRSPKQQQIRRQRNVPPLPGLSPVAAAAANAAASMPLPPTHQLPSVLEIPDTFGDDSDSGNNKSAGTSKSIVKETLVEEKSEEQVESSNSEKGHDTADAKAMPAPMVRDLEDPNISLGPAEDASGKTLTQQEETRQDVTDNTSPVETELADDTEPLEVAVAQKDTTLQAADITPVHRLKNDRATKEEDFEAFSEQRIAAVLASSRAAAKEEHFHDTIMSAVAKAEDVNFFSSIQVGGDASDSMLPDELDEVTSILSMYEGAEQRAMEQLAKARAGIKSDAVEEGIEKEQSLAGDITDVTPLDDLVESKKVVTFLEPLSDAQDEAMCGCAIQ